MKFEKETTLDGALIPRSALRLSQFGEKEEIELHTLPNALVVLKKRMTAAQLAQTVDSLTQLSTQLIAYLSEVCGKCDKCGEDCDEEDGGAFVCPHAGADYIELTDAIREEAGFSPDDKLCVSPGPKPGTAVIEVARHKHDLRDLSPDLLLLLSASGVCLGELEDWLISEDIIYGQDQ